MLHLHGIKSQPEWRPAHSVGFPHCCGIQSSQLRQGEGFPGGTSGKEPTRLRHKKCGFDFWVGRSPGGHGNPLQYFFPGESHGQRNLVGYSPWGSESDMTEIT